MAGLFAGRDAWFSVAVPGEVVEAWRGGGGAVLLRLPERLGERTVLVGVDGGDRATRRARKKLGDALVLRPEWVTESVDTEEVRPLGPFLLPAWADGKVGPSAVGAYFASKSEHLRAVHSLAVGRQDERGRPAGDAGMEAPPIVVVRPAAAAVAAAKAAKAAAPKKRKKAAAAAAAEEEIEVEQNGAKKKKRKKNEAAADAEEEAVEKKRRKKKRTKKRKKQTKSTTTPKSKPESQKKKKRKKKRKAEGSNTEAHASSIVDQLLAGGAAGLL